MITRRRGARARGALVVIAGVLLSACSQASPTAAPTTTATATSTTTTSTTTTSTSTTTTTTTTTIPIPQGVNGTKTTGAAGFLGPAARLPVVALAPREEIPPPGSLGPVAVTTLPRLAFREIGAGPDLLVISGEHATMTSYDLAFLSALSASYRVTIFDLPGAGYSESVLPYTVSELADLTAGLIVELNLTDPVVLGWGLGATVALSLAERHADLIDGLILADPIGGAAHTVAPSAATRAVMSGTIETSAELAAVEFSPVEARAKQAYLDELALTPPDDIVASAITEQAHLVAALARSSPVAALLHAIRMHVLIISGTADLVAPFANAVALEKALPSSRLLPLDGAGYAGIFAETTRVVAAIASYVATLPTPTSIPPTTTTTSTTVPPSSS